MPASAFFGAGTAFALVAADFVAELFVAVEAAGFLVVADLPVVVVLAFVVDFLAVVALAVAAFVVAAFAGRDLVAGFGTAFAGLFCSRYVNRHITCSKLGRRTDLLGGGGVSPPSLRRQLHSTRRPYTGHQHRARLKTYAIIFLPLGRTKVPLSAPVVMALLK